MKVEIDLPVEFAERILSNKVAFITLMKENGIEVRNVVAGSTPAFCAGQKFNVFPGDGSVRCGDCGTVLTVDSGHSLDAKFEPDGVRCWNCSMKHAGYKVCPTCSGDSFREENGQIFVCSTCHGFGTTGANAYNEEQEDQGSDSWNKDDP